MGGHVDEDPQVPEATDHQDQVDPGKEDAPRPKMLGEKAVAKEEHHEADDVDDEQKLQNIFRAPYSISSKIAWPGVPP